MSKTHLLMCDAVTTNKQGHRLPKSPLEIHAVNSKRTATRWQKGSSTQDDLQGAHWPTENRIFIATNVSQSRIKKDSGRRPGAT